MRRTLTLTLAAATLAGCYGSTESATNVTDTSARLSAHGATGPQGSSYYFEYAVRETDLGTGRAARTSTREIPVEVAEVDFFEDVRGLAPATEYFFRLCGSDVGARVVCAQTRSFTTFSSPYAGEIAFTSNRDGNYNIYVMNGDGSNLAQITDEGSSFDPAWSPDGTQIAFHRFVGDFNWEIFAMASDGANQTNLTNHPTGDFGPAWSPDGERIAFESGRSNYPDIWVMASDGATPSNLTDDFELDSQPAWSPDGKRIAFVSSFDGGPGDIYVIDADGGNRTMLTDDPGFDLEPAWSPDGERLAFTSDRGGNGEIYVMDSDGGNLTNLTNGPAYDENPAWSPDGERIAFSSGRDGNAEIYVMDSDGTNQTRLTTNPGRDIDPAWSPLAPPAPTGAR